MPQLPQHNWDALKVEWLARVGTPDEESLNAFRVRKGIGNHQWFYRKVEEGRWLEAKADIMAEALRRVKKATVAEIVDDWKEQRLLWRAVEIEAAKILRRYQGITGGMPASELAALTRSIESALKNRRLLDEKPTDIIEGKGMSPHLALVEYLEEKKRGSADRPAIEGTGEARGGQAVEDGEPILHPKQEP